MLYIESDNDGPVLARIAMDRSCIKAMFHFASGVVQTRYTDRRGNVVCRQDDEPQDPAHHPRVGVKLDTQKDSTRKRCNWT